MTFIHVYFQSIFYHILSNNDSCKDILIDLSLKIVLAVGNHSHLVQ